MFLLFFFVQLAISAAEMQEPDPGHHCAPGENGTAPGIKYYFDEERMEPYPFFYNGCGGNSNRYDTKDEHMLMDYTPCPGYGKPKGSCRTDENGIKKTCEKGYFCVSGYRTAKCCKEEDRVKDREDRLTKCPLGSKGLQNEDENAKNKYPLFGRNCTHNFCHEGATCVQGHFHAYCCLN